jgi:hypothetical protein
LLVAPTRALVLPVVLALCGCAVVVTAEGDRLGLTSSEFRAYVERVFREQNRLASELAFELEDAAAPRAELAAAEQALIEACAGVNELATARRDAQDLGARGSLVRARSVPDCERATAAAAQLLAGR